jgi:hypothetical protein
VEEPEIGSDHRRRRFIECIDIPELASSLSHGGVHLVAPAREKENETGDQSIWD